MARTWGEIIGDILAGYSPISHEDAGILMTGLQEKIATIVAPEGVKVIHIVDWKTDFHYGTDESCGYPYPIYEKSCPVGGKHRKKTVNKQEICSKCGGIYEKKTSRRR